MNKSAVITSVSNDRINFQPGNDMDGTYEAFVKIGNWEKIAISKLSKIKQFDPNMIGAIGVVAGVIIIAVVFCIVAYFRRKSKQKDQQIKDQVQEMHDHELHVANVAKSAFDDLMAWDQMKGNSTDTPTGLNSGLPFRDYRSFVLHVMFPPGEKDNEDCHMQLQPTSTTQSSRAGTLERTQGLRYFSQLLGQQPFLLTFIRTLERQPGFAMKDRTRVAAMLMIALQDRLEYATIILQYLMVDMMESARPDQLRTLLRQSGTVAEKMLSFWFTMLMHRTLFERTGQYLYELFQSAKSHIYSGPVDELTGHAKFTLSETYLLRVANFSEKEVFLQVIHTEAEEPQVIKVSLIYIPEVATGSELSEIDKFSAQ